MEVNELKLGNLIKISPRQNEEGILFLTDIQQSSVIGEMLIPREGYHFRIKFDEILPLEITDTWLTKLGFTRLGETEIWIDSKNFVRFKFSPLEAGFLENDQMAVTITFVHQLQNIYHSLTNEILILTKG